MFKRKWISQDRSIYVVAKKDGELIYQGKQRKSAVISLEKARYWFCKGFFCVIEEIQEIFGIGILLVEGRTAQTI